jgi:hypothetical protein
MSPVWHRGYYHTRNEYDNRRGPSLTTMAPINEFVLDSLSPVSVDKPITAIQFLIIRLQKPMSRSLSDLGLIDCGKAGFGQILRSFSLNIAMAPPFAFGSSLKRSQNLPQTGFPSQAESPKSDRLLVRWT